MHHPADVFQIGDVQLRISLAYIREDIAVFAVPGDKLYLIAKLPIGTCY